MKAGAGDAVSAITTAAAAAGGGDKVLMLSCGCRAQGALMSAIMGLVRSVMVKATTERVLPRPIQWAKIAPLPTASSLLAAIKDPIVFVNKNFMASSCEKQ